MYHGFVSCLIVPKDANVRGVPWGSVGKERTLWTPNEERDDELRDDELRDDELRDESRGGRGARASVG